MGFAQPRRRAPLGETSGASSWQATANRVDRAVAVAAEAKGIMDRVVNIFDPGRARDQQRESRANFFRDAANIGSVVAGQYILGGLVNTAGNEIPYYEAAESAVHAKRPDVMDAAHAAGALWAAGIPDPGGSQSMVNAVSIDLRALQNVGVVASAPDYPTNATGAYPVQRVPTPVFPAPVFPTSGGVVQAGRGAGLPAMHTTAPYNYAPWLLGGGVVAAALLLRKR